jgi:hypothetical protein
VATVITLLLVPVLHAIFVLDLKLVREGMPHGHCEEPKLVAAAG